jgi:hypothetical protein
VLNEDQRVVAVRSDQRTEAVRYTYDTKHNGRLINRQEGQRSRVWTYDEHGFIATYTDENQDRTSYVNDERGNVERKTTCRDPEQTDVEQCEHQYFGYFLNPLDPLDPRNDQQIWSSDARSADAEDTEFRTSRELDPAGRVTKITYPVPAGQSSSPSETFAYSSPYQPQASTGGTMLPGTSVLPMTSDHELVWQALPFPVRLFGKTYQDVWISMDGFATLNEPVDWPLPHEQSMPDPREPNAVLMPFMDYLSVAGADADVLTATTGTAPNRTYVIEWRNVAADDESTAKLSFEIVLAEGGGIEYRYSGVEVDDPRERGSHATIGIENEAGTTAAIFSHDQQAIADGTVIAWPAGASYPTQAYTQSVDTTRSFVPADDTVLSLSGDDASVPVTLPFPVRYFGRDYTRAW